MTEGGPNLLARLHFVVFARSDCRPKPATSLVCKTIASRLPPTYTRRTNFAKPDLIARLIQIIKQAQLPSDLPPLQFFDRKVFIRKAQYLEHFSPF